MSSSNAGTKEDGVSAMFAAYHGHIPSGTTLPRTGRLVRADSPRPDAGGDFADSGRPVKRDFREPRRPHRYLPEPLCRPKRTRDPQEAFHRSGPRTMVVFP